MKLEHSAVNVKDAQAVAHWWSEHLGLRIVVANDTPPYIHFLADEDGAMMEIYSMLEAEVPDWAAMDPRNVHFAFSTQDAAADRDRLVAAGASVVSESVTPAGDDLVFLKDPYSTPFQLVKRKTPLL